MRPTTRFRELIGMEGSILAPGAYDGLSARLVERAGFSAVYASGGAISRSSGLPDLGLLSLTEISMRLQQIVDSVDIPVIADMDTGYGNTLNVVRAVRAFEHAGVAAFHLEDQTFPKRCGHYSGRRVIPPREFCGKIAAAKDALTDHDTVIIARTDALSIEGLEKTIARMHQYMEAGADVAFVEAPRTADEIEAVASQLSCPKLMDVVPGGHAAQVSVSRLQELGFKILIFSTDLQRAAVRAMAMVLSTIGTDSYESSIHSQIASFLEREDVVGTDALIKYASRFES
jgi:2-methylisocitrate lyase-like PEP mutase family enzyme